MMGQEEHRKRMEQTEQGIFIVIEGSDGSGKSTQFERLRQRLTDEGHDVAVFKFPQYDQPSSHFVRAYLDGRYGQTDEVGPYTCSLFYALDRYEAAAQIRQALNEGKVVLSDRYVGSNMAHQGTKFLHAEERRGYFIWLDNLEFELLGIPRPTVSMVLRMPAEVSVQLIDQHANDGSRSRDRDVHENDYRHLKKTVEVFDEMCQLFPRDFARIDCTRDQQLLAVDTIHDIVWQKAEPLLPTIKRPAQATKVTPAAITSEEPAQEPLQAATITKRQGDDFYMPDTLAGDIRGLYSDIINRIMSLRSEIAALLVDHTDPARDLALRSLLPVAASSVTPLEQPDHLLHVIHRLTKGHLPAHYADSIAALRLASVWPRNELDLVADIVYAGSDLPLVALQEAAASWPYELKLKLFEAYLASNQQTIGHALPKTRYCWDMLCDYATMLDLQAAVPSIVLEHQMLTPRYGYDVPSVIDDAGVTEQFETCFELSLQLHSSLQEAGLTKEAQYATLLGHKTRGKLTHGAGEALQLFSYDKSLTPGAQKIVQLMHEKLAEVHPIIGETVKLGHDAPVTH
nr:Thymidylate kinase [uncultured bacterium]